MTTLATLVSGARVILNDTDSVRYTDAQLVGYANDAIKLVRRIRPDLFFGGYKTALSAYVLNDEHPFDSMYDPALVDYIVGKAETRDDDYAETGRATLFLQSFRAGIGA
jgi:hypothetical protein